MAQGYGEIESRWELTGLPGCTPSDEATQRLVGRSSYPAALLGDPIEITSIAHTELRLLINVFVSAISESAADQPR